MRELLRITHALGAAAARREGVVLATVMSVEGSVYRGTGARMVVNADASTVSAVSGGCLEADIVARAPEVRERGVAELVRYDTRASDDVVLGLGLGCQGIIEVLLEPLAGRSLAQMIGLLNRLGARRRPTTVLTLLRDDSDEGLPIGSRLLLDEMGAPIEGEPSLAERETGVACEIVRPAIPVVICGGGSDAIPLARLAKAMGWHVTVVDHRPSFAARTRFPDAGTIICANLAVDPGALTDRLALDERTMAVVMAHSAVHDRAYLHVMLAAGARYVGVLGPRRRTVELLGEHMTSYDIPANVHAPVGLDLGAETPDEIALAIVAEIAAVHAERDGGMLRERSGPIHMRSDHQAAMR